MNSYFLTIMIASFAFISCSNDDDQYNSAIVGKWKITEVKTSKSGSYIAWPFKTTYALFKSDGTYYGSGYFGAGSGTWAAKGNTINTYVDGKLYVSYTLPSFFVVICRWGPVDIPELPDNPSVSPALTNMPFLTQNEDRWQ